ncbi:glycosyltransferase family 9 protein [Candidatus Neptunochlamydia vexilliferae]|uniref:Glycosyltransferase family 9 protein n=1 Tax=Candidatus Neptunichlamydia vexilliferae TaxID=1651774 RepID=A0ABS0B1J6_9BACT|nr:glycosyltransferase family 9 protein [Candidatus Neptunochlamydia vexilliferae]MBF5060254.1 hypothetical protein [Candidatus Neptunochlamydia vexilliferae]
MLPPLPKGRGIRIDILMKNTLLNLAIKLGPKKKNKGTDRILVVSTTGLGDSLWGSPAIRALRQKYPNAYIALLTSPIGKAVFQNNPHLNEIFLLSPARLKTLRKKRFETAYIFHTSQRIALPLAALTGPSKIVGTLGINKGMDHLLTHPQNPDYIHEIERRLKLVGAEGAPAEMELFLTEREKSAALKYLPDEGLVIGMHPGAKDKFKQWSPKHFVTLGRRLAKEKEAKIVVTGDKGEAPLAKQIAANIPGAVSVAGKLPLRVSAALIEKCDLFITNDTGPMHIALAMKTPTYALFSPTDPKRCGPYKAPHGQVIEKPLTCTPCIRKRCQEPFCMEQISPDEVYERLH